MSKITQFIAMFLIGVMLMPVAFAKSEEPIYIDGAKAYTEPANQGVVAKVTVCNSNSNRIKFTLKAKNLTINDTYKRRLTLVDNGCEVIEIDFTNSFSDLTQAGDKIEFSITNIKDSDIDEDYDEPNPTTVTVEEQDPESPPCGDKSGDDDEYDLCVGDFLTHNDTKVRIKLIGYKNSHRSNYVDLLVSNIRWGGSETVRVYSDRTTEVTSRSNSKLKITNYGRSHSGHYLIQLQGN
ncbi:hypothetical protein KKA95_04440 [Patescibacteria group bacterium]|nr:hypothetical protein [Patescibacteria group bacterium]